MTRERMHTLSVSAARDRLAVDDALDDIERRLSEQTSGAERLARRREAGGRLVEQWPELPFAERQGQLRELTRRITVHDDGIVIELRA